MDRRPEGNGSGGGREGETGNERAEVWRIRLEE